MTYGTQFHLLVVDDDLLITDSLRLLLPKNWRMTAVQDAKHLDSKMLFHAAFVDMHLTGKLNHAEGPEVISRIWAENPQLEIVAMSGDLSMELMERCLKAGAKKFIAKPLSVEEVLASLEKIEALWMMRTLESRGGHGLFRWVGKSAASTLIKESIASLRGESGPILIEGETGSGKEVAFRILNQQELNRPFVSVNIAAISENLFESEFFGHVKGAFTGADTNKLGLAEAAQGGDLFLDEIEALALNHQVKLLRFLETGEIRKVGAKDLTFVKCRVITASNQPLHDLVAQGRFREDLLFRLSGKKLRLPPLRDRTEDITELANFFLSLERPRINKNFAPEAIAAMTKHSWPGNVRELKRVCEQAALIAPLPVIRAEDVCGLLEVLSGGGEPLVLDFSMGLSNLVEAFEAKVIRRCLTETASVDEAAEKLQISRSSLYKKLKDYNIDT